MVRGNAAFGAAIHSWSTTETRRAPCRSVCVTATSHRPKALLPEAERRPTGWVLPRWSARRSIHYALARFTRLPWHALPGATAHDAATRLTPIPPWVSAP
jgi:hypothetical protein